DFCNAICVSLQAPFYPHEAEAKGASASEYGLVFGIFELVVFIVSPLYGQHLNRIGPKFMFNVGTFTVGTCAILFGLLDKVNGHVPFIVLSFIIRIIEAMGNAAFLTASFAIIAKEFPDNVATTFASLETFFGLGLIVGPTVGGALYEVGGYTTPFAVLGSMLFLAAILTIIVVTSMSIGFLQATLEPHLRRFGLSPVVLGLMFVINGGTYALTAPCFGWLCDQRVLPKAVTACGCLAIVIGFSLVGPAPFFPMDTELPVTILGLVCHGLGIAAQLVASFTDALRTCVEHGFPNDLETYGLVSGLWTSTFALGAFIGPSVAGFLYDSLGFRNASMFVVGLNIFVGILVVGFLIASRRKRAQYKQAEADTAATAAAAARLGLSFHDSSASHNSSHSHMNGSARGVPIERPPGMQGIIARNSYKNRHGTWHMKDSGAVFVGPYSSSYGSAGETRGLLDTPA
ncbi:MFS-type transporter SLC18B1, partial [Gryllus bimaculatus]